MRVAMWVKHFPALSETFILNQITGLIDRGHEVDIFALHASHQPVTQADIDQYKLLDRTRYFSRVPRKWLPRVIKQWRYGGAIGLEASVLRDVGRYDVVHCQFGPMGVMAARLRAAGRLDGPIVTAFRGGDVTVELPADPRKFDQLFEVGDLFLPVSDDFRVRLIAAGVDENKIVVHRSGIDCDKFSFVPRKLEPGEPVRFLTVGRLIEVKGIAYAIRAMAKLVKADGKAGRCNVDYTIVGDGELRVQLEKLISDLNVTHCVYIAGWREHTEVAAIMQRSHVLIHPSITNSQGAQEGVPNVLKEASAVGLAVVGTNYGGIPEIVVDGKSGYLVPEKDVDALADRLGELVAQPETWSAMGAAGRAHVEAHYDVNKLNDRLVEHYQRVRRGARVGGGPAGRPLSGGTGVTR